MLKSTLSFEHASLHGGRGQRIGSRESITSFGYEVSILGLFAWRGGYIDDPAGGFKDWTWGIGVGTDLLVETPARVGARFDMASQPQAGVSSDDSRQYDFTFWVDFWSGGTDPSSEEGVSR